MLAIRSVGPRLGLGSSSSAGSETGSETGWGRDAAWGMTNVFWTVVLASLAVLLLLGWRFDRKHGTRGVAARRDRPSTAARREMENRADAYRHQRNSGPTPSG